MADNYYTLAAPSEGIYREKMSKFMAFAAPAESAAEAKEFIAGIQKKYFDARHVCWAYMVGPARTEFQSNDNDEPSGTAGKPILGQINSFNLTNVAIAVVRYFGGIKLGTSGLITAYREAAREAIAAGEIIEMHDMTEISFTYPYLSMERVMRLVKGGEAEMVNQQFDNVCSMTLRIRTDLADELKRRLSDVEGLSII